VKSYSVELPHEKKNDFIIFSAKLLGQNCIVNEDLAETFSFRWLKRKTQKTKKWKRNRQKVGCCSYGQCGVANDKIN
jgi:hypothetical protein